MIHPRSSEKTSLAAADESRRSPVLAGAPSGLGEGVPPPPHRQLLSDEPVSYEVLNGHDHTQEVASHEDLENCCRTAGGESSIRLLRKISAVKSEGGGSWLLGLARLVGRASLRPAEGEEGGVDPPQLVRGEPDEDSRGASDSEDDASAASEEDAPKRRGVSFNATVVVQPIPHSSSLTPSQRRRMYCSSLEVHRNKVRNKKEFRHEGKDWRRAAEEWQMDVDMVSGELVHPAHEEDAPHDLCQRPSSWF